MSYDMSDGSWNHSWGNAAQFFSSPDRPSKLRHVFQWWSALKHHNTIPNKILMHTSWFQENLRVTWGLRRLVQHCNFWKKLRVIFSPKFQNPASVTFCTNALSVYQAQNYCISPKFPLDTSSQGYNTKVYTSFPRMNKFLFSTKIK